jgi:hypothetical protein
MLVWHARRLRVLSIDLGAGSVAISIVGVFKFLYLLLMSH